MHSALERLDDLDVLVVDGQSTGASPTHGHLLELGWARARASTVDLALDVDARLVALPDGATIPRPVARLTGIELRDLVGAPSANHVWAALREAATPGGVPLALVIHYARFEAAFLHALHQAASPDEPFPLAVVCTHEIARRLLPGLPRRGLRALAGYLGHGVDECKRSAQHVRATAFVWRELVARLRTEQGVTTLAELDTWLARPPPPRESRRAYPMPRDKRLALPDEPGVYRMLRSSGEVLYVGKATSLRQRVNGYFRQHRRVVGRTLEMLTEAQDLRVTPTATVLEAALLESDEIKAHAPPYNVMLRGTGPGPWYATPELSGWCEQADARRRVGPLRSRGLLEVWAQLARPTAGDALPEGLERVAWWAEAPDPAVWREGWARFAETWLPSPRASSRAALARVGAALWQAWRTAEAPLPEDEAERAEALTEAPLDPVRVAEVLERIVGQGAHELRRARWLCDLRESAVSWCRRDGRGRRCLVLECGRIVQRADEDPSFPTPLPPGWARTFAQRRAGFDMAGFDRLRVLTSELRRLVAEGRAVELCLGPRRRLDADRLRRALTWV